MMNHRFIIFFALICNLQCYAEKVQFNKSIKPILSNNCFSCHGPDEKVVKGGLQLHLREKAISVLEKSDERAITPGDREESSLWHRINSTDPDEKMPPPESNHKLTKEEIDLIGKWIDEGAEYQGHWSFEPLSPQQGSIDEFIRSKLRKVGLNPSPKASREILIRRLSLDLTGLPPSQDAIESFIKDKSSNAYERLVDQLINSKAFAERLAVNWLDAARYADTNGYSIDDHRDMWIWRDWVISSFMENKPYDQFTLEQIAGDLIPKSTTQQKVATGFLRNSMNTHEGRTIGRRISSNIHIDKVDTVSTVFMGLTMKCAQCHDHKYDPISQEEYYKFFAFFNTSSEPGNGAINANTAPLIEAESAICSIERVKRDAADRINELREKRVLPEQHLIKLRNEWEKKTLNSLNKKKPNSNNKNSTLRVDDSVKWIWSNKSADSAYANFRRIFNLDKEPKKASVWFTCDNECKVKVNGQNIGSIDDWTKPKLIDIDGLVKGENTIEVEATNVAGSKAGLILSLHVTYSSEETLSIVTNSEWEFQTENNNQKKWTRSFEIANYGEGLGAKLIKKTNREHSIKTFILRLILPLSKEMLTNGSKLMIPSLKFLELSKYTSIS